MMDFLETLRQIVGEQHVQTTDLVPYATDWRQRYHGKALAMVWPGNTAEVAAVVKACQAFGVPLIPQGGNTSTCGAATPDDSGTMLLLGLKRLRQVRSVDVENGSMVVEAGLTLAEAQQVADQHQRLFPLSLASEGSCQIGGNLSTNAGGLAVLKYGTMRDLCLGLEVVLPDGEILHGLSGLRKDTSGLDVKQLFIGAEGQLGIITAASLKLYPKPKSHATAWIGLDSIEDVIHCFDTLKQALSDNMTAFEVVSKPCLDLIQASQRFTLPFFCEWAVLVEITDAQASNEVLQDQLTDALMDCRMIDGTIAQSEQQRSALWAMRESLSELQKQAGPSIKHDIGVPVHQMPHFIQAAEAALKQAFPSVKIVIFGHIGDGNLHYNLSYTRPNNQDLFADEPKVNAIVYDLVYQHQGTLAAEHGIGQLKAKWLTLYKDPAALRVMKAIKSVLDPNRMINPNKWL